MIGAPRRAAPLAPADSASENARKRSSVPSLCQKIVTLIARSVRAHTKRSLTSKRLWGGTLRARSLRLSCVDFCLMELGSELKRCCWSSRRCFSSAMACCAFRPLASAQQVKCRSKRICAASLLAWHCGKSPAGLTVEIRPDLASSKLELVSLVVEHEN